MRPADRPAATVPFEAATHADDGSGTPAGLLVWRFPRPVRAVATAVLGGGIIDCSWVLNAHVRSDYARTDPDAHLRGIASAAGLDPDAGAGLLTAATLDRVATATDGGVRCDATVGLSYPTWAAAADRGAPPSRWHPGTINIVCQVPVPLTPGALIGAVVTVTEAKTQALVEAGVPGTGTASDALVVCCAPATASQDPQAFAGPRSRWGARLARAVRQAVAAGVVAYGAPGGR